MIKTVPTAFPLWGITGRAYSDPIPSVLLYIILFGTSRFQPFIESLEDL